MLKIALIGLAAFLASSSAPQEAGSRSKRAKAKCSNSRGGKCTVLRSRNGKIEFKTTRLVEKLHLVPASSSAPAIDLVFDGVAKDCTAKTTCPDGTTVECSAVGPNTQCTSNATSVGCLTADDNGEGTSGSSSSC